MTTIRIDALFLFLLLACAATGKPISPDVSYNLTAEEGCSTAKFVYFEGLDPATLLKAQRNLCLNLPKAIEAVDADAERYKKWFGEYSKDRSDIVKRNFQKLYDGLTKSTLIYENAGPLCDYTGMTGHTFGPWVGIMYTCPLLYSIPTLCLRSAQKSIEGTLLREWMFDFADTYPGGYGAIEAKKRAKTEPDKVIHIGDNYEYFYCKTN